MRTRFGVDTPVTCGSPSIFPRCRFPGKAKNDEGKATSFFFNSARFGINSLLTDVVLKVPVGARIQKEF